MSMDLVLVHGGNSDSPAIAKSEGWLYGTRDNYIPYGDVYMFDWDWKVEYKHVRWLRYLSLIAQHRPHMAMAPDFETPDQWPILKRQIIEIKRAGAKRVIFTPKFDEAIQYLPGWRQFIIGVSVPTEYASFLPEPKTMAGRELHFLGGAPDQWVYLRRVYEAAGARVISADGNFAMQEARRGKYWSCKKGGYVEMRGEGFDTEWLVRATLRNVRRYVDFPPDNAKLMGNERVQKCVAALSRQLMMAI